MKSARYPNLPPLNTLLVFETAARHNSFSQAAEELCMSASAVAHQIKRLEAGLNLKLFTRYSQGVQLNRQGHTYFGHVQQQLDMIHHHTEQLTNNACKPLRIVTLHAIAQLWLQPRLSRYQTLHQEHNVDIIATSSIPSLPKEADIAINYFADSPPTNEWQLLWEEYLLVVCQPTYEFSIQKAILYQDTHWRDDWPIWEKQNYIDSSSDISFNRIHQVSLYTLAIQSVRDGLGIMAARASLIKELLNTGQLISLPGFNPVPCKHGAYYLYQSESSRKNPFANRFCQWLKESVNEY